MERTLSIIKPDLVEKNKIGAVINRFEDNGLKVVAQKRMQLSQEQAQAFYAEHKERPFFGELVGFMTSGPVVVQVLQGDNAIKKNRELMGATNPNNAEPGTIRYDFCRETEDLSANGVHGSDAPESAQREISFFFTADEIVG
jgi:nucleoside-diphosphate kinase